MKRMFLLAALLSSATFLVSCGGGGGGEDATVVATDDLELRVDATNGQDLFKAMDGESFVYDSGVPGFETTTPTKVDIVGPAGNGAGLGFRISSDGKTASGTLEFGSCIFRIRASDYTTKLEVGTFKRVRNCEIKLKTTGVLADGQPRKVRVDVVLDGVPATRYITIRVTANGTVVLNSVLFGTVKVRTVTGTGGF